MTLGDTLPCSVEALAFGGDGIARVDGRVVFVPETAVGDRALVRVTQLKKNYARAGVVSILEASPDRTAPCCRTRDPETGRLERVPGCAYDHLAYDAELRAKAGQLSGFLARLKAPGPFLTLPAVGSPDVLHYRNKIVLHTAHGRGGVRLGYRREPSHSVLDIPCCPLACDGINTALSDVRRSDVFLRLPGGADVIFRYTRQDGPLWWSSGAPATDRHPPYLTESSPCGPLKVSPDGFYQVNPAVADLLVRTAAGWFAEDPDCAEILDLYCGVGVFGFACLARGGTRLLGIEAGREAVAAARLNAESLGFPASFLCHALGRAPLALASLVADANRTTAIVDPPREGLDAEVTRALTENPVARLLYVSCDPATLTRDLALLLAGGRYRLVRAQLFDMFPRTAHFETLVELRRQ